MGLLSLLTLPMVGFRNNGWAGLLSGGWTGGLYGSVFCLYGMFNGLWQLSRGVWGTPDAIRNIRNGLVWDGKQETWKLYYLADEKLELERHVPAKTVVDFQYYDILNVKSSATPKEIKRSYYRLAKELHPDKNPNDATAAERFRTLHTAYLVLSDTEKRRKYDEFGASSNNLNLPDFDPYLFYAILFNSQTVEPYVGDLTIGTFTDQILQLLQTGRATRPEEFLRALSFSDHRARSRQLHIALFLDQRISGFLHGTTTTDKFRNQCRAEASAISLAPFGNLYLEIIGTNLVLEAAQFLGFKSSVLGWVGGTATLIKRKLRSFKSMISIVRETIDVLKLLPQQQNTDEALSQEETMLQLLPELLDVAWAYNARDIASTLHGACTRLFHDASINSKYKQLERAQAIQMIGQEFLYIAEQKNLNDDKYDAVARMEVAFQISSTQVRLLFSWVCKSVLTIPKMGSKPSMDSAESMIQKKSRRSRMRA